MPKQMTMQTTGRIIGQNNRENPDPAKANSLPETGPEPCPEPCPEPGPKLLPELVLEATLYTLEQLRKQTPQGAQLALVGRSNVGKSSLLNALARRKNLAKTSAAPGKTRSVNLFKVMPDGFYLTDLPGYGYAKRSKQERRDWGELIESYLLKTGDLSGIVLLLDCRLPPQETDKIMADFARGRGIPLLPILTKADKCTQRERAARQKDWAMFLQGKQALPVSARTGLGIPALWQSLRQAAGSPYAKAAPNLTPNGQTEKNSPQAGNTEI